MPETEIIFDASLSRPITETPLEKNHLNETTWVWSLNDQELEPMRQNYEGKSLVRGLLKKLLTVGNLMTEKGLESSVEGSVILHIDKGKGAKFEKKDEVKITVELDTETPAITGISESITMWPPNHKHRHRLHYLH